MSSHRNSRNRRCAAINADRTSSPPRKKYKRTQKKVSFGIQLGCIKLHGSSKICTRSDRMVIKTHNIRKWIHKFQEQQIATTNAKIIGTGCRGYEGIHITKRNNKPQNYFKNKITANDVPKVELQEIHTALKTSTQNTKTKTYNTMRLQKCSKIQQQKLHRTLKIF